MIKRSITVTQVQKNSNIKGEITREVIETLVTLMGNLLGQNAVDLIIKELPPVGELHGRDLVFRFSEEAEKLLGTHGAHASLRQVGRDLAASIAAKLPQEQWLPALKSSLNDFGFADHIEKKRDSADICNCVFYEVLEERGLKPTGHPVCWCGWGFIEGFMKRLEQIRGIEWRARDQERHACEFVFLRDNFLQ